MIYYTSDLHLGHKNIIKYENRPFKDIHEMTLSLIKNWNNKIKSNDEVYILGDLAFIGNPLPIEILMSFIKQLNGKIHLIRGNHDKWVDKKNFNPRLFESINYYKEIKDQGKDIILCHYPIENWNGMEHGSIHLHGHLHSYKTELYRENRFNVGVDNWNYEPVSLDEITEKGLLYVSKNNKY